MSLGNALYKSQDQSEADLTQGPGWTIDEQKPSFFENTLGAIPRGIGQGAAAGLTVLTHGIQFGGHASPMDAVMNGPLAASQAIAEAGGAKPAAVPAWKQDFAANAEALSEKSREFSKSLIPDPRITGTGANIIQGFSKAVTEFTAGSVVGGPVAGAEVLGAAEGYARYQDLKDQGVDEDTAKKSGLLEALTAGGSALLPMGMPARWLKGLTTPGTLLAQAGAGAVINTSFGAASRYASAKILADAGYPEQAELQKPWDETNLITDSLAGLFFGAHAGLHGLKAGEVDPAIRDAAKTVQDRQEVNERAPGVPVDMKSAAVHRQALEQSLGDLMNGRRPDLSGVDLEGATFARPEVDESQAAAIIREEFKNSGVAEHAAAFDRWLAGEGPKPPKEVSIERPEAPETEATVAPKGGEETPSPLSPGALADRPDLQIVNEHGEALHAGDEQTRATEEEAQANKEAEPMFQAAVGCEARHA